MRITQRKPKIPRKNMRKRRTIKKRGGNFNFPKEVDDVSAPRDSAYSTKVDDWNDVSTAVPRDSAYSSKIDDWNDVSTAVPRDGAYSSKIDDWNDVSTAVPRDSAYSSKIDDWNDVSTAVPRDGAYSTKVDDWDNESSFNKKDNLENEYDAPTIRSSNPNTNHYDYDVEPIASSDQYVDEYPLGATNVPSADDNSTYNEYPLGATNVPFVDDDSTYNNYTSTHNEYPLGATNVPSADDDSKYGFGSPAFSTSNYDDFDNDTRDDSKYGFDNDTRIPSFDPAPAFTPSSSFEYQDSADKKPSRISQFREFRNKHLSAITNKLTNAIQRHKQISPLWKTLKAVKDRVKSAFQGGRTRRRIGDGFPQWGGGIPVRAPNPIAPIAKYAKEWRQQLPCAQWSRRTKKNLVDERGKKINISKYEQFEQYLVQKWIKPDDIVLELGGRCGVVSCTINSLLKAKQKHIVVEPDPAVLAALKKNRATFGAKFSICDRAISDTPLTMITFKEGLANQTVAVDRAGELPPGAAYTKIDHITNAAFRKKYALPFTALVLDCEGCACKFIAENMAALSNLTLIMFEMDNVEVCNYDEMTTLISAAGFTKADDLLDGFQQVWIR